jgi:uncharacterized repeat protein (TIGR03843 family)
MTGDPQSAPPDILSILMQGEISLEGEFLWGSNYTFLVRISDPRANLRAVYKPIRGERPLWDFPPHTLAKREVAAFITSEALGWEFVPPTVLRQDGPAGPGSVQLFVNLDPQRHYFTFSEQEKERLRPVALFDALINNADRKGGHVLLSPQGKIWLIDHGVCFHHQPKLRTVIWDFAGTHIPAELCADVTRFIRRLRSDALLSAAYAALLSQEEIVALLRRGEGLIEIARFPLPSKEHPYPWPLV